MMTRFESWIIDWVRLAESIVGVVTLSLCRPFWSIKVTIWSLDRRIKRGEMD